MCQTLIARRVVAVAACAMLTLPWSLAAAQAPDAGKRVALLVGVNKYENRNFRDLQYAERDVEELGKVLDSAGYEVHLLTGGAKDDKRATLENLQKHIEAVLKGRTKKDLVLVALAGHGLQLEVTGGDGKLRAESFYCPADAEQGNSKTMLAMGKLFDEIDRRGGGHNLVLVDACREVPTRGRGLDGSKVQALPEGVAVLFGCRSGQKTFETKNAGGGHGVFFHFVLEGLKGPAQDDEGEVTWNSLVGFVSRRVARDAPRLVGDESLQQTPNLVANLPGESPILLTRGKPTFAGTQPGQEWDGNGLKMKLCWCPPGKFTMGSPKDERGRAEEGEDQVEVMISRGFWLGKCELTQGQWQKIMETTLRQQFDKARASTKPFYGSVSTDRGPFDEGASYPVSYVNHDEATEFCRKLTEQERKASRLPASWEYTLPTEAQWEYACRAGTTTRTAFKLSKDTANFDWGWQPNGESTGPPSRMKPVGSYQGNAWGLQDMYGNVDEWCRDWYAYAKNPRRHSVAPLPGGIDPEATEEPSVNPRGRVIRGGNYGRMIATNRTRSAARGWANPGLRALAVGFRVALVQTAK